MRTSLYDYCREYDRLELLQEWHPTKNAPLTPEGISRGSKRSVWWKCERGHEWQAMVYTRTGAGTCCPYCVGKKAWPGENDLASQRPDLAAQWHPAKNPGVTPADVPLGSHRKVWWLCEKGHVWQAMVNARTHGTGCPVCTNRRVSPGENDLATVYPDLARQWHPARNGPLTPHDVVPGARRRVWWKCEKGHEWQALISSRTSSGAGCPVCAGKIAVPGENDLASLFPDLAAQWHPDRNGQLTAESVTPYSNKKVWWRCPLGHEYQAVVAARASSGSGCPYCAGRRVLPGFNDLATVEPRVAAQWHTTLNGGLTAEMVTAGSHRMAWWECPSGHAWKAVIHSRAGPKKCGCPVCAGRVPSERMERYAAALNAESASLYAARFREQAIPAGREHEKPVGVSSQGEYIEKCK